MVSNENSDEVQQTVGFQDMEGTRQVRFAESDQSEIIQTDKTNVPLGEFLSRPLRIGTIAWTQAGVTVTLNSGVKTAPFNPWEEFLTHSSITPKTENFRLLRGKLHVRAMVNGNPFYKGRIFLAYEPLYGASPFSEVFTNQVFRLDADNAWSASQLPKIVIDPTVNMTGDLVLPFVYWKDWIDLNTFPTADQHIGSMWPVVVASLDSSNNAPVVSMDITLYAWMEDVELAMPTAFAQMDEYGQGIISKPASAIADASRLLSNVPVIGKFARATEIGARAVAGIASLFGFSRPIILEDTRLVKNEPFPSSAVVNGGMAAQKLSLDAKQELSIDGSAVGLGQNDDMTIANMAGHESLIAVIPWTTSVNAGDLLQTISVHPGLVKGATYHSQAYEVDPAVAAVSRFFEYWRGPLVYKFTVVASKYHRGRFQICYEPDSGVAHNTDSNVTYTRVIDISETQEFEYVVDWAASSQYLQVHRTSNLAYDDINAVNGTLHLTCLNRLTAPADPNSVTILVTVRAGEGFQLAAPTMEAWRTTWYGQPPGPPGLLEGKDEDQTTDEVVPQMDCDLKTMGSHRLADMTTPGDNPKSSLVYFGESISSMRALVKRQCKYGDFYNFVNPVSIGLWRMNFATVLPHFPTARGHDEYGPITHSGDVVFTNASTHMAILARMFATMRGSVRWHYVPEHIDGVATSNTGDHRVWVHRGRPYRNHFGIDGFVNFMNSDLELISVHDTNITNFYRNPNNYNTSRLNAGFVPHYVSTQSGISVEKPYYNNKRFSTAQDMTSGNAIQMTSGAGAIESVTEYVTFLQEEFVTVADPSDHVRAYATVNVSAGEDFNCNWFLGHVPYQRHNTLP